MDAEEKIAALFREEELRRRALRRSALMRNEAALLDEKLDEQARAANAVALEALQNQQQAFEKATRGGYWKRLWNALLGR